MSKSTKFRPGHERSFDLASLEPQFPIPDLCFKLSQLHLAASENGVALPRLRGYFGHCGGGLSLSLRQEERSEKESKDGRGRGGRTGGREGRTTLFCPLLRSSSPQLRLSPAHSLTDRPPTQSLASTVSPARQACASVDYSTSKKKSVFVLTG